MVSSHSESIGEQREKNKNQNKITKVTRESGNPYDFRVRTDILLIKLI